jgi:hypothetical protein
MLDRIHTSEPIVPGTSHLEVEIAIVKLKKYKSPRNNLIPVELIVLYCIVFIISSRDHIIIDMEHVTINKYQVKAHK